MIRPSRGHPGYWAFVVHRLSGVALALFLPIHFLALGLALRQAELLDALLEWTERPLIKFAETLLIIALSAHLGGGLRLMALEFLPWHENQKALISGVAGFAIFTGMLFLLNAAV